MTATAGYTRVEHWIADGAPQRPASVTILLLILARHTTGWQRDEVTLSVDRLAALCGLSDQGTRNAINYAISAGLVTREAAGNSGHTYQLCCQGVNSVDPLEAQTVTGGSTECSPGGQLSVALGVNSVDPYIDRVKIEKDRESNGASAPPPVAALAPEQTTTTPQQAARPIQPVHSAAPPVEVEQPRLVDAAMPDPIDVYRQVAGVKRPTQAQREAIRRHVTSHPELWREACDYFARNAYNVRKVDNLIDRYQKAVAEAQKLAAAAKRAEDERRRRDDERDQPYATLEERRAIRDKLRRDWYNTAPAEPRPALMARGRT